ncbi:glycosyltransferase family A protein [Flavobacterium sp. WV_118_3]|uniref:glycosyltransferase family A protein n=1 Tax=Flavobacterium sp. WV_118_3 TaxID=3151764 RepID=UPI00321943EE
MRVGFNPHKDQIQQADDYFHQVILPVYIPSFEGYFKDSFAILKYCIESLWRTVHAKTYITIVNNGSCETVVNYLNELLAAQKIHELLHTSNIGKMNAVLKGLSGNNFPLVTIADSDVMFLPDWQMATYAVFENFPKAGAVCPTPSSRSYKTYTANVLWDYFWSRKLHFTAVKNPEGLKAFGHSVGNENFYNRYQLEKYLTLTQGNTKAVIGAGHYLATYRSEIFKNRLPKHTKYRLGGTSERDILDIPVVKSGYYRLATEDNFAYHLGNVTEPWMEEILQTITKSAVSPIKQPVLVANSATKIGYWIKTKLFSRLLFNKNILPLFFRCKGLPANVVQSYLKN